MRVPRLPHGAPSRAEVPFFNRMWVRLAAGSTFIVILAISFTAGLILRLATDELRTNILQRDEQIARRAAEAIGAQIEEARRDLTETADILRLLDRMPLVSSVLLENHVMTYGIFEAVVAVDPAGQVLTDNRLGPPDLTIFGPDALTKAGGGAAWTSPVDADYRGVLGITFVVPAGPRTTLIARLSMERIWKLIIDIDAGPGASASLVDGEGTIIAHRDKRLVMEGRHFDPAGARNALLVSSPVSDLEWTVYIEQPVAQAFIPISLMLRRSLLLVLAGLTLALLLAGIVAVLYSRSLDALLWGTMRIAEGDLDHRIEARSRDEFGVLSHAFNDMVHRLRERTVALAESERRYRHVTESVRDIIFSLDHEGRVVFLNSRADALLGMSRQKILGRSLQHLLNAQGLKQGRDTDPVLAEGGMPFPSEVTVLTPTGEEIVLELEGERVGGAGGQGEIHGIARDVTNRRRMEEKLRRSERLAALGEIVSKVAHELRNAVAGITASMELARTRGGSEGMAREMDLVLSEAQRAQGIVQGLLGSSTGAAERRSCSLNAEVASVVELRCPRFAHEGIEVTMDPASEAPIVVANPDQLRQVFHNIIDNAECALRDLPSDRPRRLGIRTGVSRDVAFVEITDTGRGIPPELIGKIFDPFFTTRGSSGGSGLGLAVSLAIAEGLGGDIAVRSKEGDGACFTVELPVEHPRRSETAPDRAGTRVLVVEDEPAIREFVHHFLESLGCRVNSVANGQEAVACLADGADYALVITDFRMPGRDGQDLYEWIRASRPRLLKRLIYITGDSLNPATRLFLEQTGLPYLLKPVIATRLAELVRATLAASVG